MADGAALTADTEWAFIQTNKVMNGKVLNNFKVKGRGTQMNLMIQEMGTFKTLR